MAKPDAWMPLYIGDYLADTTRFTAAQHGAYLLLLMDYWRNGAPPDDASILAQIARCTAAEWRKIASALREKFTVADGRWTHSRVEKELAAAKEHADKAHAKAEKAASARWVKHPPSNAPSIPQALHEECPSPSPLPLSSLRSERKRAQARALPEGFGISQRVAAWAGRKRITRLDERFEHFVGKAKAHDYRYADWDEAFMGACRDDWAGFNKPTSIAEARAKTNEAIYGSLRETYAKRDDDAIDGESIRVA